MADPTERITLRYVPQFVCLAGDCKENCCSGLRVELSATNHDHLVARAAGTSLQGAVEQLIKLEPPATRTQRLHSFVDADGKPCPFLDADWLCKIHRELGEDALADPCSLFPRVLTEVRGRVELSATLACPETARLCLTTDGAVDLVPLPIGAMAREIVVRRFDDDTTDPYVALLDEIRQVCLAIMNRDDITPPVRLLVLADFAERIEPFFRTATNNFTPDALSAAIDRIPDRIGPIAALHARTQVADLRAVRALKEIIVARLPGCDNARFNALVRPLVLRDRDATKAVLAGYFQGDKTATLDDVTLQNRITQARARIPAHVEARRDEHVRRYAINAIVKDWYTRYPTLASSLRQMTVRLALGRWATITHPSLDAGAIDAAALDAAAIDAFQIVAKNIEHNPAFMELSERYLHEAGLANVAGLALLLAI